MPRCCRAGFPPRRWQRFWSGPARPGARWRRGRRRWCPTVTEIMPRPERSRPTRRLRGGRPARRPSPRSAETSRRRDARGCTCAASSPSGTPAVVTRGVFAACDSSPAAAGRVGDVRLGGRPARAGRVLRRAVVLVAERNVDQVGQRPYLRGESSCWWRRCAAGSRCSVSARACEPAGDRCWGLGGPSARRAGKIGRREVELCRPPPLTMSSARCRAGSPRSSGPDAFDIPSARSSSPATRRCPPAGPPGRRLRLGRAVRPRGHRGDPDRLVSAYQVDPDAVAMGFDPAGAIGERAVRLPHWNLLGGSCSTRSSPRSPRALPGRARARAEQDAWCGLDRAVEYRRDADWSPLGAPTRPRAPWWWGRRRPLADEIRTLARVPLGRAGRARRIGSPRRRHRRRADPPRPRGGRPAVRCRRRGRPPAATHRAREVGAGLRPGRGRPGRRTPRRGQLASPPPDRQRTAATAASPTWRASSAAPEPRRRAPPVTIPVVIMLVVDGDRVRWAASRPGRRAATGARGLRGARRARPRRRSRARCARRPAWRSPTRATFLGSLWPFPARRCSVHRRLGRRRAAVPARRGRGRALGRPRRGRRRAAEGRGGSASRPPLAIARQLIEGWLAGSHTRPRREAVARATRPPGRPVRRGAPEPVAFSGAASARRSGATAATAWPGSSRRVGPVVTARRPSPPAGEQRVAEAAAHGGVDAGQVRASAASVASWPSSDSRANVMSRRPQAGRRPPAATVGERVRGGQRGARRPAQRDRAELDGVGGGAGVDDDRRVDLAAAEPLDRAGTSGRRAAGATGRRTARRITSIRSGRHRVDQVLDARRDDGPLGARRCSVRPRGRGPQHLGELAAARSPKARQLHTAASPLEQRLPELALELAHGGG